MSTYTNVWGLSRDVWEKDNETMEPDISEDGRKIEEFYYDRNQGNLHLSFESKKGRVTWERGLDSGGYIRITHIERLDESKMHYLDIPIKANSEWNEFVDSLPKWEDP